MKLDARPDDAVVLDQVELEGLVGVVVGLPVVGLRQVLHEAAAPDREVHAVGRRLAAVDPDLVEGRLVQAEVRPLLGLAVVARDAVEGGDPEVVAEQRDAEDGVVDDARVFLREVGERGAVEDRDPGQRADEELAGLAVDVEGRDRLVDEPVLDLPALPLPVAQPREAVLRPGPDIVAVHLDGEDDVMGEAVLGQIGLELPVDALGREQVGLFRVLVRDGGVVQRELELRVGMAFAPAVAFAAGALRRERAAGAHGLVPVAASKPGPVAVVAADARRDGAARRVAGEAGGVLSLVGLEQRARARVAAVAPRRVLSLVAGAAGGGHVLLGLTFLARGLGLRRQAGDAQDTEDEKNQGCSFHG
jgi:hypothetical protein